MRRLALLVPLFALTATGCKKDELQAALDEANAKLSATQKDLAAEKQANSELRAENQSLQERIADLEAEKQALDAQIEDLAKKAGVTAKELAELRKEKLAREKELKVYKDLIAQLKKLVDAGTIKLGFRKGRMIVQLDNSILFDSGKTELKEAGQAALTQLATALTSVGNRDFLIAGHTDNVPIRSKRFRNNWELSTARAVEVVTFLTENGMKSTNVGAAGFGEFDPVGDNNSDEGRAQNRRIEIILMPKLGAIPGLKELLEAGS
jgi:chemotaxis protein MotB